MLIDVESMSTAEYITIPDEESSSNRILNAAIFSGFLLTILGVTFIASKPTLTSSNVFNIDFLAPPSVMAGAKPSSTEHSSSKGENTETKTKGQYDLVFAFNRDGYDPIDFLASDSDSIYGYKFLEDYMGIIEPYVENSLYVYNIDSNGDYVFKYTVCAIDSSTGEASSDDCSSGELSKANTQTINIPCSPYDEFEVTINKYLDDDESVISTNVEKAMCLYVRRDIKSLTSTDLSTTMDAMYELWKTSDDDGQSKYGSNYHSISWLTNAHLFNAAQRDADHIHEGLGFLPQHLKITNYFELSVQAVNPAVSLPYWDYTYESGDITESVMFTEDTFGSIVVPVDTNWGWTYKDDDMLDAAIPDGRWAQTKADVADGSSFQNGFGYLRGPWNMNPSPYISRYAVKNVLFPSCSNYYDWLSEDDFVEFLSIAPFAPHAAIHGDLGGTYGCDKFDDLLDAGLINDESSQKIICKGWFSTLKELYRSNYINPSDDCSVRVFYDEQGIDCGFDCDDDDKDDMISSMKKLIKSTWVPHNMSSSDWETWRDFVCTGDGFRVFSGDQLESASPSDPSFWPIHPNLERLYHAKMMSGGFENTDWPSEASDVCDKSTCYEEIYGDRDEYEECCAGHYENDQLLDFVNNDATKGYGQTNRKMLDESDPTSTAYTMPYIYDDFSWSHCEQDFYSLMETLAEKRRLRR